MPVAALVGATIGGSVISGLFGKSAADTQSQAALQAAQIQQQSQAQALDFQKDVFSKQQADAAPWLGAGQQALTSLGSLLSPGGSLTKGYQGFEAPTGVTEQNDPGFQFRLQQGQNALQRSAAATGGLLTGGFAKGLEDYAQNDASNEYQNVYNRALQNYQVNANNFYQNQSNLFNRYSSMAGLGQQANAQIGQEGSQAAQNTGNLLLGGGAQVGQDIQNAAYQTGSGYAAIGNALGGGLGNIGTMLGLRSLLSPSNGASPISSVPVNNSNISTLLNLQPSLG